MFIKGNLREYTRTPFVKTLRYSVSMKKLNDTAVSVDISTGGLGMIAGYPLEPGHVLIFEDEITNIKTKVIVHPHPNPPPSRGRELIRYADKYSLSTGGRGLGGGGAELLQTKFAVVKWIRKINNGEYRIGLNFL
jgi:hypothetical protein